MGLGFHPSQSTSSLYCNQIDGKICYKNNNSSNHYDNLKDHKNNDYDNNNYTNDNSKNNYNHNHNSNDDDGNNDCNYINSDDDQNNSNNVVIMKFMMIIR